MISKTTPLVIYGAGAIGCYLGAHWAAAGVPVTLLGRSTLNRFHQTGLRASPALSLPADSFAQNPQIASEPQALAEAGLIVLTVKSTALETAIAQIEQHAKPDTPIVCLLNGLAAVRQLRTAFPDREIAAGMVPFNVVWNTSSDLRRTSVGHVTVEQTPVTQHLAALTANSNEPLDLSTEITSIQHGKLLLNLINPVNALSGLSLYDQLQKRPFRRVYAAALAEALTILDTANIPHAKSGPLPASAIVKMLRTPDWFFNAIALKIQKLDPQSQTSMASDLAADKPTEIDALNGEILRIAAQTGQAAPVNQTLVNLIKAAEKGDQKVFTGTELLDQVRAAQG